MKLEPLRILRCTAIPAHVHPSMKAGKAVLPVIGEEYYAAKPFPLSERMQFWKEIPLSFPQGGVYNPVRPQPDFVVLECHVAECFEPIGEQQGKVAA